MIKTAIVMKKLFVILAVSAIFVVLSCSKEQHQADTPVGPEVVVPGGDDAPTEFSASLPETKTHLGEKSDSSYPNYWSAGDVIYVNGIPSTEININAGGKGENYAVFTMDGNVPAAADGKYYSAYPASAVSNWNSSAKSATITIPATQNWVDGNYDPEAYIMVGSSTTKTLNFNPVMGLIKLTTTAPSEDLYIKSITVEPVGNESMCGTFTTDYSGITGGTASSGITISAASGTTKTFGTVFTFAVPAQKYASGVRFRIVANTASSGGGTDKTMVFAKQSAFTVAAGTLYPLTAPAFKESAVAISLIRALTSSSIQIRWNGSNVSNNKNKTWRIHAYTDSACTSEFGSGWTIPKSASSCWDPENDYLTFVVGGLARGTQYWFKVEDVQNGVMSDASSVTTQSFSQVSIPAEINSTGVILAEDFNELPWGSTVCFRRSAGFRPSNTSSFSNLSTDGATFYRWNSWFSFRASELNTALTSSRLNNWMSEGDVYAHPGHLKLGTGSTAGWIVTPEFPVASGKNAVVTVTVEAAKYNDEAQSEYAVAVLSSSLVGKGSGNRASSFTWPDTSDETLYQTISFSSASEWQSKTASGLVLSPGDRIVFGRRNGGGNTNPRIFVNSITVEATTIEDEMFKIKDVATLQYFMTNKPATAIVTADINMSGQSFTTIAGYTGTLHGNGHTISNLTKPFFADLQGNVDHLTLNSSINATTDTFGEGPAIFAQSLSGGGSLSYCTSKGSVTFQPGAVADGTRYVAGLVGYVTDGSVTNCTNEASVSFPDNSQTNEMNVAVGGVVAKINHVSGSCSYLSNSGSVSVGIKASSSTTKWLSVGGVVGELCFAKGASASNLTNDGTVSLSGSATGEVCLGGVIGFSSRSVSQCANSESVSYTGSSSGTLLVGGVVGNSADSGKTISSTVNSGEVVINSATSVQTAHIGGIAGKTNGAVNTSSANLSGGDITITSLTASGNADYYATGDGYAVFIGGVVGEARGAVDASNEGDIAVNGLSAGHMASVGGVVGTNQNVAVTGANSGDIVVSYGSSFGQNLFLGGVVGHGKGNISGSTNEGLVSNAAPVTTEGKYLQVGGIVGYNNGSSAISNCTNSGDVTNSGTSKGYIYVGGITSETDANITSCHNTGEVSNSGEALTKKASGKIYHVEVAGVAGQNNGKTITSCYNTGSVSNAGDSGAGIFVGGVCGQSAAGTFVTCYNTGSISNSGFANDSAMYNDVAIGGLVGYLNGNVTLTGTSSAYNYNNGPVEETSTTTFVGMGGVVGHINGSGSNLTYTKNLANGDIKFAHNSRNRSFIGGVVGCAQTLFTMNDASNAGNLDFEDLTIIGTSTNDSPDLGRIFIGGVFGGFTKKTVGDNAATYSRLSNSGRIACWKVGNGENMIANSSAECNGMSIIAGVAAVGWVKGKTFTDCTNSGRIAIYNAIKTVVGGVIGYTNVNPSGCINTGAISYCRYDPTLSDDAKLGGNGEVGGVVGDVDDVTVLSGLTNDANVRSTGSSPNCYTGGIAGWVHNDMTGFSNCNVGTTTGDGSSNNYQTISGASEDSFGSSAAGIFASSDTSHSWDFNGCKIKKGTKCQNVSFSSTSDANFQKALIGRHNPSGVTNPPTFVTSF